jgi:glycosyltransferase involved in cell wall biosynthesis
MAGLEAPSTPAISVIATAYNTGEFLAAALESALRQSLSDFEVVLVDDASTDDTFDIAQSIARRDGRIQVIRHETNLGAGGARNTALKRARGALVSFLDTDDVWEDQFLEEMSRALATQGDACAGVFCYSRHISPDGSFNGVQTTPPPGRYDLLRMMEGLCPPGNGSALMIRRACLDQVGEFQTLEVGQDAEMWLRIAAESSRSWFYCLPRFLVRYRHRSQGLRKSNPAARLASFEYRLRHYAPRVDPSGRWRVYFAFARMTDFVGPELYEWRRAMSRKALSSGRVRALTRPQGMYLLAVALLGVGRYNNLRARLLRVGRGRRAVRAVFRTIESPWTRPN